MSPTFAGMPSALRAVESRTGVIVDSSPVEGY